MNYTLFLTYIVTDNVSEIQNTHPPIVIPSDPGKMHLYQKTIKSFSSFLTFYEQIGPCEKKYESAFQFYRDEHTKRDLYELVEDYEKLAECGDFDFVYSLSEFINTACDTNLCEINIKMACEVFRMGGYEMSKAMVNDAIRMARVNYDAKMVEKGLRYLYKMNKNS